MSKQIDVARLTSAKTRGGKTIAQCPACAANGGDKYGDHLVIYGDGRFGCVAFAGDREHRRQIAGILGSSPMPPKLRPLSRRPIETPVRLPQLPPLRVPTVGELIRLAEMRGLWTFAGLELAIRAGQLRCAEMRDAGELVTAWLLLDSSGRNAQARRLDGIPGQGIDAKAKTLLGSQAAWPIGAADMSGKPFVALCEGGPDTLAAWSLAWWHGMSREVAPVCLAGAGTRIHADALPLFVGKGIWLFPHRDEAGERAQRVWTAQLRAAGALWVKPYNVAPQKDLNDHVAALARETGEEP